tara:strand:- start:9 stop:305 length:297 start_codon:yes stop_codon:yes gene_type:complete
MKKPLLTIGTKEINKDKVLEILGDITWFMGILILQTHKYDDVATKKDAEVSAIMMHSLSDALGFSEDDITAIITYSDNKLNEINDKTPISMHSNEEEE